MSYGVAKRPGTVPAALRAAARAQAALTHRARKLLARVPQELRYALGLFVCTRLVLTGIGLFSRKLLDPHERRGE